MATIQYYDVILKPVITEKSMNETSVDVERYKKEVVEVDGVKKLKKVTVKDKKAGTEKYVKETATIRKYTFLVHPQANKFQIKDAVEKMFDGAKVARVNTMNCDGRKKRRGMIVGKTAKTKKAIVWLTEDSKDIEIFAGL